MKDDHALLKQFNASRDEHAFAALVSKHLPMVFGVCLRRTENRELAEELTQNVFTRFAKKAAGISPDVNLGGWLHRAASFECSHALRTESNRNRTMKRFAELRPATETSEEDIMTREASRQLDEAINQLPKKEQDIVLMRFSEDLTLREIGCRIGKSESATQRHLSRVLEKLGSILRRRGVTASTALLAALLSSNLSKAAPLGFSAASVSKAALAAAATSTPLILTTIAMTKKTATTAAAIILITAAGGIALKTQYDANSDAPAEIHGISGQATSANRTDATSGPVVGKNPTTRKERTTDADAALVARYGESKVKLSRHIAERMIHLEELKYNVYLAYNVTRAAFNAKNGEGGSGVFLFESIYGSDTGGFDPSDPESFRNLSRDSDATPEELLERKKHAEEAFQARLEQREKLKKDSTPLQRLLLAEDAVSRGEMSLEEFESVKKDAPPQAPPVMIFGNNADEIGNRFKPKSLDEKDKEIEKQIERQIASPETINTLMDNMN